MIPAVRGMVSQDPINHLNCRKTQLLALAANGNPQVDLLMHSALERTFDIYRHCYLAGDYRWSYPVRYVTDPDLTLLGYQLLRSDRAEPGDVRPNVLRFLAADQAVLFMAPRGYLPYWREFMRANQTRESEYYDLHSFLVGGLTPDGDGVLLMDNANEAHEFRPYPVTWAQLREGRAADPDRWFVDNVVMSRVGDPDPAPFARMHAAFVAEHEDEFELYEVIAEQLASEREMYPEAYRVPGINALALVAGSRRLFTRYLQLMNDDAGLLRSWEAVSRSALHALAAVSAFHAGDAGRRLPVLQAQLHQLAAAERAALQELRRSAASCRP